MNRFWALLVALCAAGVVLSSPLLLATIQALQPPVSPVAVFAIQCLQALVLCALAAYAGVRFATRAGLDAPWLRAWAERRDRPPGFAGMAIESAAIGSVTAIAVTAVGLMLRSPFQQMLWRQLPAGFWTRASSAFYGGIVEETIVRWGLLSTLVVLLQRVGARQPFWPANVVAALVFGVLHLPSVVLIGIALTTGVYAHVLFGNAIAGAVFGWIFRRRGLEGAMVAHGVADVWLQAALPALLA
jgi:membrane protease YdiL (CAAX protease family)